MLFAPCHLLLHYPLVLLAPCEWSSWFAERITPYSLPVHACPANSRRSIARSVAFRLRSSSSLLECLLGQQLAGRPVSAFPGRLPFPSHPLLVTTTTTVASPSPRSARVHALHASFRQSPWMRTRKNWGCTPCAMHATPLRSRPAAT